MAGIFSVIAAIHCHMDDGCIDIFVDYQVLHSEQDYVLFYRSFSYIGCAHNDVLLLM